MHYCDVDDDLLLLLCFLLRFSLFYNTIHTHQQQQNVINFFNILLLYIFLVLI